MNIDFSKLFSELLKHPSLFILVLGAIFLLVAALGGLPFGGQALPAMEPEMQYILTGSGAGLLFIGLVLVWREQPRSPKLVGEGKASGGNVRLEEKSIPDSALDPNSARQLMRSGLMYAFRIPVDNPRRLERVIDLIKQEVEEGNGILRLAASSGFSYLSPNGPVWTGAGLDNLITSGIVRMTVVLESPFSQFAVTRALANQVFHHHWQEKIGAVNLIRLLQYPNLCIRVTEVGVNCSLFFTSRAVYYDPYLWALPHRLSRTENRFWVLEFDRVKDPCDCYTILEKHFDFLLRFSVPLEEVLHAPEKGSPVPLGQDFYYFYQKEPELALNRYEKLSKQFQQNVRSLLEGRL
jgi:hypothetical protein